VDTLPAWMTIKRVYVLKSSFPVVYEAGVDDKDGATDKMLLHLEQRIRLLPAFERRFGLS